MLCATTVFGSLFALGASPASAATTADIVRLTLNNVGGMACTTNSLGGQGFLSSCTGNGGEPEYWCADFAKWVWQQEGVQNTGALTPAAASFYSYGTSYGTFTTVPRPGYAAVFSASGPVSVKIGKVRTATRAPVCQ